MDVLLLNVDVLLLHVDVPLLQLHVAEHHVDVVLFHVDVKLLHVDVVLRRVDILQRCADVEARRNGVSPGRPSQSPCVRGEGVPCGREARIFLWGCYPANVVSDEALMSAGRVFTYLVVGVLVTGFAAVVFVAANGAGHGTALPFDMFSAPGHFGLLAWPVAFALCGLPRRWAGRAFLVVLAILIAHNVCAWYAYSIGHDAERERTLSLVNTNPLVSFIVYGGLLGAYAVQLFLLAHAALRCGRPIATAPATEPPPSRT